MPRVVEAGQDATNNDEREQRERVNAKATRDEEGRSAQVKELAHEVLKGVHVDGVHVPTER